jgi:hypothetical protein
MIGSLMRLYTSYHCKLGGSCDKLGSDSLGSTPVCLLTHEQRTLCIATADLPAADLPGLSLLFGDMLPHNRLPAPRTNSRMSCVTSGANARLILTAGPTTALH